MIALTLAVEHPSAVAQDEGTHGSGVFVVHYDRVLNQVYATTVLRDAEATFTATLQGQIDEAKAQLAAEEAALARRRPTLSSEEFEELATDFDLRIRLLRRIATERAKLLQRSFEKAREGIVREVQGQLVVLQRETGAKAILRAESLLAWDEEVDLTDRLIALVDEKVTEVDVPAIDFSEPILDQTVAPVPDQAKQ